MLKLFKQTEKVWAFVYTKREIQTMKVRFPVRKKTSIILMMYENSEEMR